MYQLLNIIVPLITTPYISRVLGVSGVGYNSYVASIVNYFSLFIILGTYTYGQREIGANQNNKEKYTIIFLNISILKIVLGAIGISAYFLTIPLHEENLRLLFLIRVLTLFANTIDVSWFFQGMENFQITATRQMGIRILGAISVFMFVRKPEHLVLYAGIDAGLALAGNISILPYLKRYLELKDILKILRLKTEIKVCKYLKGTIVLFVPQIATSLYMSLDKSMIGYFYKSGLESGYYEQATKIHAMGLALIVALTSVLIPRIALLSNEKNDTEMQNILSKGITYVLFMGAPLAAGISAIGYNFLQWFLGTEFTKSADVLQITALLIFIMGLTNFLGYGYMVATAQNKAYTITVVCGTCINFVANCLLIPQIGALGAAIASVFSECCVLFFQVVYLKKKTGIYIPFYEGKQYIISAAIMGIITTFLSKRLTPNFTHTMIIVVVGVIVYIMPLLIIKDRYLLDIIQVIVKKVRG